MSEDDGLPPYYVYLEPIEDFYSNNSINIEVIVTDRNEIDQVSLFYKFDGDEGFTKLEMAVSYQPVIYEVEIPSDEVISGSLQYYFWATDVYGNQSTWPDGGEDMPVVIPVYTSMGVKKERIIEDYLEKRYYEKPSVKRRKAKTRAMATARKAEAERNKQLDIR